MAQVFAAAGYIYNLRVRAFNHFGDAPMGPQAEIKAASTNNLFFF